MPDSRKTLLSYFQQHFLHNDDIAYVARRGLRTERWSYQQIGELAAGWAARLAERNVVKGDRVLLWAENSAHWVAAFYGCLLRGAIVVPLDAGSDQSFAARVQQQVGAKVLLADCQVEQQSVLTGLPTLSLDTPASRVPLRLHSMPVEQIDPNDLVEIIFTSGTTAEPRGVCLTHRNLLANLAPLEKEIQKYLSWERWFHPVRFLNLVPLSHVFGQFMAVLVPPLLKGEVHFQNVLNPGEVIEAVKTERISVVVTVPRFLESLKEKLERDFEVGHIATKQDGSLFRRVWRARLVHQRLGWKFWAFVSGGATLPESTEAFWRNLGFAVVQGYGMTETAAVVSVAHPFKPKEGSIGKQLSGMEMKVAANGEILVRGENISPGFWSGGIKPLTDAEGWLHTGDLARTGDGGHLYFQGRQKDVIVTASGLNIYPEDLEAALNRQKGIRTSAVIGVEGRQGPEPVAVLLLRDASLDAAAAAVANANRELAAHQQIRRWLIWPEADFPRTPTQKVRKPALGEWIRSVAGGAETGVSGIGPRGVPSTLAALLGKVGGSVPTTLDRSLRLDSDLKLDSLGRVELLSLLEDHYQVELDEARMTSATTLGDVEDQLKAQWVQPSTDSVVESTSAAENLDQKTAIEAKHPAAMASFQLRKARPYPYPHWPLGRVTRWIRAGLFQCLILPLARLLSRIDVSGTEHLEGLKEPTLFVANHVTHADPGVILAALPRRFRHHMAIAMDGERLRGWRYPDLDQSFVRRAGLIIFYYLALFTFNVFPLPRRSGFRRSFAFAGKAMDRGYHVLVFPEGRLTDDGELQLFRRGAGLLAAGLNAPIVPMKLDGLFELRQRPKRSLWAFMLRPGKVSVTVGSALRFGTAEDPGAITMKLEREIAELGRGNTS